MTKLQIQCKCCVLHHPFLFVNLGSIDFAETRKTITFQTGTNVRGCGCIGLIDDQSLEMSEEFDIMAIINDPILISTGSLTASVIIEDTNDSKLLCAYNEFMGALFSTEHFHSRNHCWICAGKHNDHRKYSVRDNLFQCQSW